MRRPPARPDHASLNVRSRAVALAVVVLALGGGAGVAGCAPPASPPSGSLLPPLAVPVSSAGASAGPNASAGQGADVEAGIVVDLLDDGSVTIDGAAVDGDAAREVFAKKPRAEIAIFRGAKGAPWGRVVHLIDLMRQAGPRDFVLAIRDDRARRTPPLSLPRAGAGSPPPIAPRPGESAPAAALSTIIAISLAPDGAMLVDGAAFRGSLREHVREVTARSGDEKPRVVIMADRTVGLGSVVDVARDVRAEGASVAFGVAMEPPRDGVAGGVASGEASVVARGSTSNAAPDTSRPRPKSKSFDACPFPAGSDKAGIDDAVVALRVKVDAGGRPTDVQVLRDPGHGFGAAAKACAMKASYDPARDAAGNAIAGEAVMRIRFTR